MSMPPTYTPRRDSGSDFPVDQSPRPTDYSTVWKRFRLQPAEEADVLVVISPEGVLLHLDPSVQGLLGYRPEELLGSVLFRHVHGSDLYPVFRGVAEMLTEEKQETVWTLRLRTAAGGWAWVEARSLNLLGDPAVNGIAVSLHRLPRRM